jgi:AhpD family alkylhydroperoxidase
LEQALTEVSETIYTRGVRVPAGFRKEGVEGHFRGDSPMYAMKNLEKLKVLEANAPSAMKAFWDFDEAAFTPGAIPQKHKELTALAVAFTTQCPYCIEIHACRARDAGATSEEIAEITVVAAAMRAGAAITHGAHAM